MTSRHQASRSEQGALVPVGSPAGEMATVGYVQARTPKTVGYEQEVGDGTTAGPYTITHNMGTRSIFGAVYDNTLTAHQNIVEVRPTGLNTCVLDTTETWTLNGKHLVLFGIIGLSDAIAPTQPTIAFSSKTDTTITVTASGATDAVGVVGYNFYIGTTKQNSSPVSSPYTYTGLASSTAYTTLNCTALDAAFNESVVSSNLASVTTNATPQVVRQATGTGARNTTASNSIVTSPTITVPGSLTNSALYVPIVTSHSNWLDLTSAPAAVTASTSNGGSLTLISGSRTYNGGGGQQTGWVFWFKKANPASGAHTITCTAATGVATQIDAIAATAVCYSGVASEGTPVLQTGAGNAAVGLTVTSQTGDMVLAVVGSSAALTALTGTSLYSAGSAVNGTNDYINVVEVAGAAPNVAISTSSTTHSISASAFDIVKA